MSYSDDVPDDLLTAPEGVDEGSAASTVEGPDSGQVPADASHREGDVVGPRRLDHPDADPASHPAPPVDMETAESRAARARAGTGQQLQVGEG